MKIPVKHLLLKKTCISIDVDVCNSQITVILQNNKSFSVISPEVLFILLLCHILCCYCFTIVKSKLCTKGVDPAVPDPSICAGSAWWWSLRLLSHDITWLQNDFQHYSESRDFRNTQLPQSSGDSRRR